MDPVTMGAGIAVVGGGMSLMSGFSQKSAYEKQAQQYMVQARLTDLQAKADEANRLDNLNRALGANKAAAAAMNIDVDSPSAVAIAEANKAEVGRQIGYNRLTSQIAEDRMTTAASQDMQAGTSAMWSGLIRMGTSMFSAYSGLASIGGPAGSLASQAIPASDWG